MKKILVLTLMVGLLTSICGMAQSYGPTPFLSDVHGLSADTTVGAVVKTQSAKIAGWQDVISIQAYTKRTVGSNPAKVILLGSLDGISYTRIATDSLKIDKADNIKIWTLTNPYYSYYRLEQTGATGVTAILKACYITRKKN